MKVINDSKYISHILICLLFLLAFSPYHALLKAQHDADDASYLSHGFTLGLDFNLQYKDMVANWKTPTGIAAHPIGPGILAAPFIASFSVIDRIMKNEVIDNHHAYLYSWSFFGFVFASVFFFILGLNLYAKGLDCLKISLNAHLFLFISSSFGILFYVLFRPIMGHAYEFFSIALCFFASCKIWKALEKNQFSYLYIFVCSMAMIVTILIRPANINIFLLPMIILFFGCSTNIITKISNIKILQCLGLLLIFTLFLLVPFAYLNYSLYGMIFPSSEVMYGASVNPVPSLSTKNDFISALMILVARLPQIWIILFSSEFGLAFSSAILFFGTLFTIYYILFKKVKYTKINLWNIGLIGSYIGLPIAIILFWQSNGDAYGHRFLFCYFPIALLGYAFWKKNVDLKYGNFSHYPFFKKSLQIAIVGLGAYGILGNVFLGLNDKLMYNEQPNAFKRIEGGGAVGYNIAVIKAAPSVSTWLNLFATRTTGFIAIALLDASHIDVEKLPLPDALSEKMEKYHKNYQHPPLRVYIQVLLLALLFIGGCILFCRKKLINGQKNYL